MNALRPFSVAETAGRGLDDRQRYEANELQMDAQNQQMQFASEQNDRNREMEAARFVIGAIQHLDQVNTETPELYESMKQQVAEFGKQKGWLDPGFDPSQMTHEDLMGYGQRAQMAVDAYRPDNVGVAKTWVNPDTGTMWGMSRTGVPYDTGVAAQQFAPKPVETGSGTRFVDPVNPGASNAPVPGTDPQSMADAKRVGLETAAGVIPAAARKDAKLKLPRLQAASRRLEDVRKAVDAFTDNMIGTGPVTGMGLKLSEEGNALEVANAQLLAEMTALTRIPGVGAQSDFEQKLQALVLPSVENYSSVNQTAMAELDLFLADLSVALNNVANGANDPLPSAKSAPYTGPRATGANGEKLIIVDGKWVEE